MNEKQHREKERFDGMREATIVRDGERCTQCGMTREEHLAKYRRDITVDHKDGRGRYTPRSDRNNDLGNLQTLCLKCHGRKDIERSKNTKPRTIVRLTLDGQVIDKFQSTMDAERQLGLNHRNISQCIKGRYKHSGGYKWMHEKVKEV